MYKYKLKEEPSKSQKFQQERIDAFDEIEEQTIELLKNIRNGKVETIKYYKTQPDSFAVAYPTDLIKDYLNDIKSLLTQDDEE